MSEFNDETLMITGALAMKEKIIMAISMSPKNSDIQIAKHIKENIKIPSLEEMKNFLPK